jgi:hypothetical protein
MTTLKLNLSGDGLVSAVVVRVAGQVVADTKNAAFLA